LTAYDCELRPVAVAAGGHATLLLPDGWHVETGPPALARPETWHGEPPGVVVSVERDGTRGDELAELVCRAALSRLADPVVVHLGRGGADANVEAVEIVVAHQHRGVDVTTVERHWCFPDGVRWVVGFTATHADMPALLPLAHRVVASLDVAA
jgi:hypothetical protein